MNKPIHQRPDGPALRQKIIYLIAIFCMVFNIQLTAATLAIDVRGKVQDEKGPGIPGASIKVNNTVKRSSQITMETLASRGFQMTPSCSFPTCHNLRRNMQG